MNRTENNIKKLIEIRDLAVESEQDAISGRELMELSHEAVELAEHSDIMDVSKYEVLKQLMNHEIRSFKRLLESDMSKEAHIENLIFFCVSVVTIVHGKIEI